MNWIRRFLAPPVFEDEDKTRIARLLNTVLLTELAFMLMSIFTIPQAEDILVGALPVGFLAFLSLGALLVLRLGYVRPAGALFSFSTWVLVTAMIVVTGGVRSPVAAGYIAVVGMVGLLLGNRSAMAVTALSVAAGIGVFIIELRDSLPAVVIPVTPILGLLSLIGSIMPMVAVQYLVTRSINDALERARSNERDLAESNVELQAIRASLEERVAERTQELQATAADLSFRSQELEVANVQLQEARRRQEVINRELEQAHERTRRRARQFQAVADVGQAITQVRDLEQLLPQVTELIGRHFDFYHVGIFLIDEIGRHAVLRAANSVGGRRMLARGRKLTVGAQGIVGYVSATGEPRIALDVGADAVHLANPDLPDTRSEMALPLRLGGQVVGVLDVQSVEAEAFDEEDISVLSTLAGQVAAAIQNARLFQQSRDALAEAEEAQRRYLRQAWREFLQQRPGLRYEHTLEGVPSALEVELPSTKQALEQGELAILDDAAGEDDGAVARAALSVPIKLRGQVIGAIDLHETDESRVWTEHDIIVVQAVADQMAQAVESARLFEQTQERASREQLVGEITARITAAASVQDILRVGSEALGKALNVPRSAVRLHPQNPATQPPE